LKIYLGVISHGHFGIIESLNCLLQFKYSNEVGVFVLDNLNETKLADYCFENNFTYLRNHKPKGFGANNNTIFKAVFNGKVNDENFFIVLNPDVYITKRSLTLLVDRMLSDKVKLATCNLYKDVNYSLYDNSVRNFPKLSDFLSSFLFKINPSVIDKSDHKQSVTVDWAAGSFLAFDAQHYSNLDGFDERFFMYCEDIDICFRSKFDQNVPLYFYPDIKALHLAEHANRKFFSKHFYWHIKSIIRYLIKNRNKNKNV
jgi:N-acetylglucosaminyl-diphospho-decaprenol L-rhamnosyltransferase